MLAFAAKLGEKLLAVEPLDRHPLWEWLPRALVSYPVCGLLAGLIGAAAWFRFRAGPQAK